MPGFDSSIQIYSTKYQPGKAMKASDCLAISAFLWCMSATAFTSPTVSPVICKLSNTPSQSKNMHKSATLSLSVCVCEIESSKGCRTQIKK